MVGGKRLRRNESIRLSGGCCCCCCFYCCRRCWRRRECCADSDPGTHTRTRFDKTSCSAFAQFSRIFCRTVDAVTFSNRSCPSRVRRPLCCVVVLHQQRVRRSYVARATTIAAAATFFLFFFLHTRLTAFGQHTKQPTTHTNTISHAFFPLYIIWLRNRVECADQTTRISSVETQ